MVRISHPPPRMEAILGGGFIPILLFLLLLLLVSSLSIIFNAGIKADMKMNRRRERTRDVQGNALHEASKQGDLVTVRELVSRNLNLIEEVNGNGELPLHLALQHGHWEVVQILVGHYHQGCLMPNNAGETPLYIAISKSLYDVVVYMLQSLRHLDIDIGSSIVQAALAQCNPEIVGAIFRHQGNLKQRQDRGLSPLSWAARYCNINMVVYLLQNFPELKDIQDTNDSDGSYPIHQAFKAGQLDILKAFYEVDCNSISKHNERRRRTILHLAAMGPCDHQILSYLNSLPEVRCMMNLRDGNGYTPIELALSRDNQQFGHYFI